MLAASRAQHRPHLALSRDECWPALLRAAAGNRLAPSPAALFRRNVRTCPVLLPFRRLSPSFIVPVAVMRIIILHGCVYRSLPTHTQVLLQLRNSPGIGPGVEREVLELLAQGVVGAQGHEAGAILTLAPDNGSYLPRLPINKEVGCGWILRWLPMSTRRHVVRD